MGHVESYSKEIAHVFVKIGKSDVCRERWQAKDSSRVSLCSLESKGSPEYSSFLYEDSKLSSEILKWMDEIRPPCGGEYFTQSPVMHLPTNHQNQTA